MNRYVLMAALLVLPATSWSQTPEPAKTIELPSFLVQRIMQLLSVEGGSTAAILLRGIDDCVKSQASTHIHITGQQDACPAVTEAITARIRPTDKAP